MWSNFQRLISIQNFFLGSLKNVRNIDNDGLLELRWLEGLAQYWRSDRVADFESKYRQCVAGLESWSWRGGISDNGSGDGWWLVTWYGGYHHRIKYLSNQSPVNRNVPGVLYLINKFSWIVGNSNQFLVQLVWSHENRLTRARVELLVSM